MRSCRLSFLGIVSKTALARPSKGLCVGCGRDPGLMQSACRQSAEIMSKTSSGCSYRLCSQGIMEKKMETTII